MSVSQCLNKVIRHEPSGGLVLGLDEDDRVLRANKAVEYNRGWGRPGGDFVSRSPTQ